jgi:SAM-dependent methyltransferase
MSRPTGSAATFAGYESWAQTYDDPGNDTIALEDPVVRALLDELPPGRALDAACGTGRHLAYLQAAGREVIGVDASEAMLDRAREKVAEADLRRGDLTALPLDDRSVAGRMRARVEPPAGTWGPRSRSLQGCCAPGAPGDSNPHPFATGVLGWRAVFVDAAGRRSMIPEFPHLHGDYVA